MHLWCFLFFCFLISRINKLHFLDTGCENAKLWFQFKGCVTASRHNSAALTRTLAALFAYFDVRKTVITISTHSRPPRRLCCGDQSPWCGCRRGGPAARTGRTRTAHWSSSASHRNRLKYVKYLKKYHAHSPLTYSWTAWTCRCGCRAGSGRTPCRGRPPSRHSWTRDSWQLVTKDANGYKTAGVLSTRVRISVGMTVYRRLVSK